MTPVVVVTGLSGAGKASMLRALEDLGYEAIDNPPLTMVETLVSRGNRPLAIGLDARTRGFDVPQVLATIDRIRRNAAHQIELVYAMAEPAALLRRYTESRRRHPLAPEGRVIEGIERELDLTLALREAADLVVDTSDLPIPDLRRLMEARFGPPGARAASLLAVTLMSFAFPAGLPREADMVFDARFLKNPHYDPILRPRTGFDPEVASFIEADPDYEPFFKSLVGMLAIVLPRFVHEGKKYATIAIGCTGGRHRSVRTVERLAPVVQASSYDDQPNGEHKPRWRVSVVHRELAKEPGARGTELTRATSPVMGVSPTALFLDTAAPDVLRKV